MQCPLFDIDTNVWIDHLRWELRMKYNHSLPMGNAYVFHSSVYTDTVSADGNCAIWANSCTCHALTYGSLWWWMIANDWCRADSKFVPSQWETALLYNDVSHWLGASLESALLMYLYVKLRWCSICRNETIKSIYFALFFIVFITEFEATGM